MKSYVFISFMISLILLTSLELHARTDSTQISIKEGFQERETNQLAELINAEKITVSFSDSNLVGKKFIISKAEFVIGEKKEEKALIDCGKDSVITIVGKDTVHYILPDACEKMSYQKNDSAFSIQILCDNSRDTAKIKIEFPRIGLIIYIGKRELHAYHLKNLFDSNYKGFIPINQKIPIIAYSPPFDMGSGVSNYCILTFQPVEEWNKYYKLNHYVVFYLEIKD
ncbi:MAG: hypothetical protein M1419_10410 [Bacteroidetes bacterium]|nr:hypothetical protein [Bacteroidota bacterium]